ncbi:MAG: M24 family metallopeptidase, partial [Sediminibacterium sp.]|nr:M24 family metallopeptidase [Sediminibacterium sp.]
MNINKHVALSFLLLLFISVISKSQILSVKEQTKVIDVILKDRLDNLLPSLMEKQGIECWLVMSREYNEDPVIKTLLPGDYFAARRTTMLVMYYQPQTKTYKKFAIARYNVDENFESLWDMKKFPDQWDALSACIKNLNPKNIALNYSEDFAHADGLHFTEHQSLEKYLDKSKFVSAQNLAVSWLETRTALEMEIYPTLISITKNIIKEAFSRKVITLGVTTAEDLEWWFRQRVADLKLSTWFQPSIFFQRKEDQAFDHLKAFTHFENEQRVIKHGDLLHVDFGITYLRLNSDIQEHAYVLMPDETDAPKEIRDAFVKSNLLQDILTSEFKNGISGNDILKRSLKKADSMNLKAVIYTHPLGFHGHAAGPTIGLWDQQNGVPGSGDYKVQPQTAYSIELNTSSYINAWGKEIKIMLEQDGFWDGTHFRYIKGRQTELILIK